MADAEKKIRRLTASRIDKILEEHELWLQSDCKQGKQANLSNAYLVRANLTDANLRGAFLTEANLTEANLTGANLRKTNLHEANFLRANLNGANLSVADLTDAFLSGSDLIRANLIRATFTGAFLTGANLFMADLTGADLTGAILSGSDLTGANLIRATFTGAVLTDTDLSGANLRGSNLENTDVTGVKYDSKGGLLGRRKGHFQGIRVDSCYGSQGFKRFAQDQCFLEEFKIQHPWWYRIWWIFADCGRSMTRWALWSVFFAVLFAWIFQLLGEGAFHIEHLKGCPMVMVYYSVVTFTTLGFGDVLPKTGWAAFWVMVEVTLGYVMLGGLISIFANKVARRS